LCDVRPTSTAFSVAAWLAAPIALILLGFIAVGCGSSVPGTIGAALGQQADHRVFVRAAPSGEGADKAGILVDDEVIALDGTPVAGMTPDDIRGAVRGKVGSTLMVTILRNGQKQDVKVMRTPLLSDAK
jgi:C-terminal processing protease CtpA/Prc